MRKDCKVFSYHTNVHWLYSRVLKDVIKPKEVIDFDFHEREFQNF